MELPVALAAVRTVASRHRRAACVSETGADLTLLVSELSLDVPQVALRVCDSHLGLSPTLLAK
ncbi:MAG: hypothetical protein M3492_12410 [Actinomycetota bacterium]|nr:hypothetical protein [Actinomycetota bacterium]